VNDNERIIRSFIAAWSRLDADELVGYVAADGVYHNMPARPVKGTENLRKFIATFLSNWDKTDWDILNPLVAGGHRDGRTARSNHGRRQAGEPAVLRNF